MNGDQSRFSLALDFACAAVTVLLSGRVADEAMLRGDVRAYGAPPAPFAHIPLEEFSRGGRYWGLLSRAARAQRLPKSSLYKVITGRRKSEILLNALISEMGKMDDEHKHPVRHLTPDERSQFISGRRYCGVYSRVARKLGANWNYVTEVGHGRSYSRKILIEIRAEMARVDGQWQPPTLKLTADETARFQPGGRYRGLYSRVARSLGKHQSHVGAVGLGWKTSEHVLKAIRAEMARVDAEFEAAAHHGEVQA